MNSWNNKFSIFALVLLALAVLIQVVSAIIACVTVGCKSFFLGLGWIGLTAFLVLPIVLAFVLVALKDLSPTGSVCIGILVLILSIILVSFMFWVAIPISRVLLYRLIDPSHFTRERANKVMNILANKKRVVVVFATQPVYDSVFTKLKASDPELVKKLKKIKLMGTLKNGTMKDWNYILSALDDKLIEPQNLSELLFNNASNILDRYKLCQFLMKDAGGYILWVLSPNEPNSKMVSSFEKI